MSFAILIWLPAQLDKSLRPLISPFRTDYLPGEMDARAGVPQGQLQAGRIPKWQALTAILLFSTRSNESELRVTEVSGDQSCHTISGLGRGLSHPSASCVVSSEADHQSRVVALWKVTPQPPTQSAWCEEKDAAPLQCRSSESSLPLGHTHWGWTSKRTEIKAGNLYGTGHWMIFKSGRLYCLFVYLFVCFINLHSYGCVQKAYKWTYSTKLSAQLR